MRHALDSTRADYLQKPEIMAEKILYFWLEPLRSRGWQERLLLIEIIDDQIKKACNSPDIYRRVSQTFTAILLEKLSATITCVDQAYVHLNSANVQHRQLALAWLLLNRPHSPLLYRQGAPDPIEEKRSATRLPVNLPGLISTNDKRYEGKLLDISRSGAKINIEHNAVDCGERVDIDISMLGRAAATVVWIASTSVGLAFIDNRFSSLAVCPWK